MTLPGPTVPTSTGSPRLDLFSVLVAVGLSSGLTGDGAAIVGAYTIIFASSCGAAAFGAASRPRTTWYGTAGYILLMVGLAMVGTVPLAELVAQAVHLPIYWLYAPIAIGIALRPEVILRWLLRRLGLAEKDTPK